jgi:hypothetical protein
MRDMEDTVAHALKVSVGPGYLLAQDPFYVRGCKSGREGKSEGEKGSESVSQNHVPLLREACDYKSPLL